MQSAKSGAATVAVTAAKQQHMVLCQSLPKYQVIYCTSLMEHLLQRVAFQTVEALLSDNEHV